MEDLQQTIKNYIDETGFTVNIKVCYEASDSALLGDIRFCEFCFFGGEKPMEHMVYGITVEYVEVQDEETGIIDISTEDGCIQSSDFTSYEESKQKLESMIDYAKFLVSQEDEISRGFSVAISASKNRDKYERTYRWNNDSERMVPNFAWKEVVEVICALNSIVGKNSDVKLPRALANI